MRLFYIDTVKPFWKNTNFWVTVLAVVSFVLGYVGYSLPQTIWDALTDAIHPTFNIDLFIVAFWAVINSIIKIRKTPKPVEPIDTKS